MFAVVGLVAFVAAKGGQLGHFDLAEVPLPLFIFAAASIFVLLCLRRI
jgi:hypothetical protein